MAKEFEMKWLKDKDSNKSFPTFNLHKYLKKNVEKKGQKCVPLSKGPKGAKPTDKEIQEAVEGLIDDTLKDDKDDFIKKEIKHLAGK